MPQLFEDRFATGSCRIFTVEKGGVNHVARRFSANAREAGAAALLQRTHSEAEEFTDSTGCCMGDGGSDNCSNNPLELLRCHSAHSTSRSSSVSQGNRVRMNSQIAFADKAQTVIILDWDDTLFPTTYVSDVLHVRYDAPLDGQTHLSEQARRHARAQLDVCEHRAETALRTAWAGGQVVVVTLAMPGWVEMSCRHFYRTVGAVLDELQIPVVYAQLRAEAASPGSTSRARHFTGEAAERRWSHVKGLAISEEIDRCYSSYPGQSWKNVLSVGDSNFERLGLLAATGAYVGGGRICIGSSGPPLVRQAGTLHAVQNGHYLKVRAKCLKLLDRPSAEELELQLDMVSQWLDPMLKLDDGFDL
eukprot:CAMPEP_0194517450 /NCGR_PEP_ID=MMETSP0253-20130528/50622_1 /TAXON_ID=2966 /ORGANISM="Noctiluca scintillans" /LENGTH=360 /DNA_ID=CAMNT_0039361413 /DNA_START=62 /DNA_END=1141 /DNA_ORIENTATION=-